VSTSPDLVVLAHHDVPGAQAHALIARAQAAGASADLWSPRDLAVEMDDRGSRVLHRGVVVQPGSILPQGINRSFAFCAEALTVLEERGTAVINTASANAACVDKVTTTRLLAAASIPVLPTRAYPWGARGADAPPWKPPLVTKPARGSNGDGVLSHRMAEDAVSHLAADRVLGPEGIVGTELVQPMADGAGEDMRIVVLDGKARGITRRRATSGFVTNGANASAEPVDDSEAAHLAVDAAAVLGLTYGAIDVIRHQDRAVVLEANCWPRDLDYVGTLCGIDLIDELVKVALDTGRPHLH